MMAALRRLPELQRKVAALEASIEEFRKTSNR
jgi:hypothetical protein